MKAVLILSVAFGTATCSQPSEQSNREARDRAAIAAAEAMCREGGKASAIAEIAEIASENPQAGTGQTAYEAASDIEKSGCADIIERNQANWQKQDDLLREVTDSAAK